MFLPLEGKTLEELMPAFGEKTRYNIRLSARKGVTTRWAGAEELETFFRIYLETCERDGIGHRPLDYFQRMLEAWSAAASAWLNTRANRLPQPSRCTTAVKYSTFTGPAAMRSAT